ncbi:hypothetical protein LX32DRAFT_61203 [Colletotrichum zoysiae]|uniref:Uncharacterized protein n=1 Tax=Colletotrichum zoysiae TaxID=1216348 RepID=A0AAD9HAW2_9PEZI|nr:hypothetical protein LX32DRAFT_61203 [Colletotrichum zoysiae]
MGGSFLIGQSDVFRPLRRRTATTVTTMPPRGLWSTDTDKAAVAAAASTGTSIAFAKETKHLERTVDGKANPGCTDGKGNSPFLIIGFTRNMTFPNGSSEPNSNRAGRGTHHSARTGTRHNSLHLHRTGDRREMHAEVRRKGPSSSNVMLFGV